MSAPHDETHEMHNEVATVARAMLSAGLAVADARRQRQLRAARDAERALSGAPAREPTAQRATPTAAEHAPDTTPTGQRPQAEPASALGTVPDPGQFSRRAVQQRADTMAATTGAKEHDARLRDVVRAAAPAAAERVLADPAWPALLGALHHIENHGGDPAAELTAALERRPLRGAGSAARVLRWRLAAQSAAQDRATSTAAPEHDTRDRVAASVLRALAEDPVGTAAAYVDAQTHRDTHPEATQAWDEALRAENIDPQHVRDDATQRDTTLTRDDGHERDTEQNSNDSSRDTFAEDYLSALEEAGVDPDTARVQLRGGDTAAVRATAVSSPAAARTMFSDGAEAARLAGLSHPRGVAEQLATRTAGGQEKSAARGREMDPIRGRDRSR